MSDGVAIPVADDGLHVAIIAGAGEKSFCVGSDLKVRAEIDQDDMPAWKNR